MHSSVVEGLNLSSISAVYNDFYLRTYVEPSINKPQHPDYSTVFETNVGF